MLLCQEFWIPTWPHSVPAAQQLVLQQVIEDANFFVPFASVVDHFTGSEPASVTDDCDVQDIDLRRKTVRRDHRTFKSLFLSELSHTINENELHFWEAVRHLHNLATSQKEEDSDLNLVPEETRGMWRNMISMAFETNKITDELPSYHVPASLYAALLWNDARVIRNNDVFDIYHAQTGIPYSDVFLTEHSLRTLACGKNLELDSLYGTDIISDPKEALDRLTELLRERHASDPCGQPSHLLGEIFNEATSAQCPASSIGTGCAGVGAKTQPAGSPTSGEDAENSILVERVVPTLGGETQPGRVDQDGPD